MNTRAEVVEQFTRVAREQSRQLTSLTEDLPLLETGLDSLCFAIIVARLEDALGVDPFASYDSPFPLTFGEFVKIYEASAAQSLAGPEGDTNSSTESNERQWAVASNADPGRRH